MDLQHYADGVEMLKLLLLMASEALVMDLLLPAGPLSVKGRWRLKNGFYVLVVNGDNKINLISKAYASMHLTATKVVNIKTKEQLELNLFTAQHAKVNAIAGIGDPDRFFNTLSCCQLTIANKQSFVDHHHYVADDFQQFGNQLPLIMTEKDAVKCQAFAQSHWWYLAVDASFNEQDSQQIIAKLTEWFANKTQ